MFSVKESRNIASIVEEEKRARVLFRWGLEIWGIRWKRMLLKRRLGFAKKGDLMVDDYDWSMARARVWITRALIPCKNERLHRE